MDLDVRETMRHERIALEPIREHLERLRAEALANSFQSRATRAVVAAMDSALAKIDHPHGGAE